MLLKHSIRQYQVEHYDAVICDTAFYETWSQSVDLGAIENIAEHALKFEIINFIFKIQLT